jgi:hypothetical protein
MSNENIQNQLTGTPIVVVRDGQSNSGGVTGQNSYIQSDRLNGEPIFQMSWGLTGHGNIPVPVKGKFYQMEFPTQMTGMSEVTGCSFTMNFCKKLCEKFPGRPIYVIACDVPGTGYNTSNQFYTWGHDGFNSYADIPSDRDSKYLTTKMVNTIKKYSPTGTVDYVIGIQGENDKDNSNYQYQVLERLTYLRGIFGNFVFAMGTMLPSWIALAANMGSPAMSDYTHRSISHLADNATTSFHDHLYGAYDGVHFNADSQRLIGEEFFNNIHRNIHAYQDVLWNSIFRSEPPIFWYDFSRQNSNYGYLGVESKSFWERTSDKWNTNTTGVTIDSHNCSWSSNDHLNTTVNASGLSNYAKMVIFTPNSITFGNVMSGSINSVLWIRNGALEALVGGVSYKVPREQLTLKVGNKYAVILSVTDHQVIFKVHNFSRPNLKISVTIPAKQNSHKFSEYDNTIPMHIGNIPKPADTSDGSEWYGFSGKIHFAGMVDRFLYDIECKNAIRFFKTYWK